MDESTSPSIALQVKPSNGQGGPYRIENVALTSTVLELKQQVAAQVSDLPASAQRLIFRGQVLRDERLLNSYGSLRGGENESNSQCSAA